MVVRAISVVMLTTTNKPNQNQNHSGAAMHAAGVESIAIITIKNQVCISTNWPWQSNKKTRTYIDTAINAFAVSPWLVLRKVAVIALLNTYLGLAWRPALAMLQPWW
jgi:hypothetical protein